MLDATILLTWNFRRRIPRARNGSKQGPSGPVDIELQDPLFYSVDKVLQRNLFQIFHIAGISRQSPHPRYILHRAERCECPAAAKDYQAGASIDMVNPADAELSTFPLVLIAVGTHEVLLDDSLNFYDVVKGLQSDSTLTVYDNQ